MLPQPLQTSQNELDGLPPSLRIILQRIPEGEERDRFSLFFVGAASAIRALGELDLARYQINSLEAMDLQLWEALAPAVKDTLNAVNAFLSTVLERFPATVSHGDVGIDDAFDDMFGDIDATVNESQGSEAMSEASDGSASGSADAAIDEIAARQVNEAAEVLRAISAGLAQEVTHFGEGLRNPAVMSDRWRLLDYVAQFRGKFRAGVGEMVFLAAKVFAAVRREDVVPFYREDTENSVMLRKVLTLVGRRVRRLQNQVVAEREPARQQEWVLRLLETLDAFMNDPAYVIMREADKRALLQGHEALREVCAILPEAVESSTVERGVEGMAKFFDSLGVMNRRELLIVHDKDALLRANRRLVAVERAVVVQLVAEAKEAFDNAMGVAQSLFGRDSDLDELLLVLEHLNVDSMDADALESAAQALKTRLSAIVGLS